ncbi:PPC domain-containing protein [cf. Phormidesmis sp. LEGE 11477]|uniref:PPC domain-containing protein n=1 Tax=cf. Phormidesmis sp. LEGE 11477 TaxID=1828680 RepID=UPI00187E542D|nr:PPC domain-containing protein [cf. Phormidesmis sp. LEGE 11477]MBE9061553.1 PPC domain-containing protein [cf. Phormidesmis sp. LEGE 11477]
MKPTKFLAIAVPAFLLTAGLGTGKAAAELYNPPVINGQEVNDTLSSSDIPTGLGGFAKDYVVDLEAGDQITVDAISEEFDTLVMLMDANGITVSENDDGPDGSTNSLLFARISEAGKYTIRVRSYAGEGSGPFSIKVARLRPIEF